MVVECMVDANPEPDIRWLHRYSNETKQEIDLSRQYSQEKLDQNRREDRVWFIKHEQLNATRWKTSLFIQVRQCLSTLVFIPNCFVHLAYSKAFI